MSRWLNWQTTKYLPSGQFENIEQPTEVAWALNSCFAESGMDFPCLFKDSRKFSPWILPFVEISGLAQLATMDATLFGSSVSLAGDK